MRAVWSTTCLPHESGDRQRSREWPTVPNSSASLTANLLAVVGSKATITAAKAAVAGHVTDFMLWTRVARLRRAEAAILIVAADLVPGAVLGAIAPIRLARADARYCVHARALAANGAAHAAGTRDCIRRSVCCSRIRGPRVAGRRIAIGTDAVGALPIRGRAQPAVLERARDDEHREQYAAQHEPS